MNRIPPYLSFLGMLLAPFVSIQRVMFLNVDFSAHIHLRTTRSYMILLMAAPVAMLMLLIMGHMDPNMQRARVAMSMRVAVFAAVVIGLRARVPIGDVQYIGAMVPHHSSAILKSSSADLQDRE